MLPPDEYVEEHLPGAVNIPLKHLDANAVADFDRRNPLVVYCWDGLCDMSPRAAARPCRGSPPSPSSPAVDDPASFRGPIER
ncbi:MAG: hypothetical protein H0T15_02860 [Thermoleophilaceae bacterium]|nr:hypothetical protein [Thermoleophilaceae bacterium]